MIQRLTVAEEDCLLALVDDQLRAQVKVLDGMLPDEGISVTLVLDHAGQAVLADLLRLDPLGYVIYMIADRAGICSRSFGRGQAHATLGAGELHGLVLLCHGVDGFAADRALGLRALALVKDHMVPAMGTGAACQLVRANIDGAAAGTVDFLSCKEPGLCFRVTPALGTFYYKSRYLYFSFFACWRAIALL